MSDGDVRSTAMFRLMALVNGPERPADGGLARGFADADEQHAAFLEVRDALVERLVQDGLPSWALGALEPDGKIRSANRAAQRLRERHAEAVRLDAERQRAAQGRGDDPGLAAVIDAQRAHHRAERRFARHAAKVRRSRP